MDFGAAETHVSWLIFMPEKVYKIKKPVRFEFVDLRDRAARVEICRREVRLNERLAPDVYLGVGLFEEPWGATEPVVVMKRLPAQTSLTTLVGSDDPAVEPAVIDVARVLADFHRQAERGPEIDTDCTAAAIADLWRSNMAELRSVSEGLLDAGEMDAVEEMALRYLEGRKPLLDDRLARGMAVDGHGDLLCSDIFCLGDGPRILDCLEFSDRLRHVDVLHDVAALCCDLELMGRPDLAELFSEAYHHASGRAAESKSLAHHYRAYRAAVRAKVACLRKKGAGSDSDSLDTWQATRLMALAWLHLREGAVRLAVVGGLPGTGKTTLSRKLAEYTGWEVLHTDEIRKQVAGVPAGQPAPSAYREGIYTADMTCSTYAEMLRRAEEVLSHGESVILDGSWSDPSWRAKAMDLAGRTYADFVPLECTATRDVATGRILERMRSRPGDSDAGVGTYDEMEASAVPWEEATELDTTRPVPDLLGLALRAAGLS